MQLEKESHGSDEKGTKLKKGTGKTKQKIEEMPGFLFYVLFFLQNH